MLETLGDDLLGLCADQAVDELTVFEDEHCRYARDLEARRGLRVLVDIQFSDAIPSR